MNHEIESLTARVKNALTLRDSQRDRVAAARRQLAEATAAAAAKSNPSE